MSEFVALSAVPAVEQFREQLRSITERTDGEKMILLKLRHGNEMAKACVRIAHRLGWSHCKRDWRVLFDCGLIKREGDRGFIVLTSNGLHWQTRIAAAMAKVAGLHFILPATDDRLYVHVRCTCGWTASLSKNEGYLVTGQLRAHSVHLDAVAKGIWKPARSVEEIMAEVMAPKAAPVLACEPIGAPA